MRKPFVAILVFLTCCLANGQAWALTFRNFAEEITLTPLAGGLYAMPCGMRVKPAAEIVVKAAAGVDKRQLAKLDPRVTSVTELYPLADASCYYRISFSSIKDLAEILACFSASPLILAAQPDLLQIRDRAGTGSSGEAAEYVKTLKLDSLWRQTLGAGVRVAVIDDGFDLRHEDLQGVTLAFGYDLATRTLDPSPRSAVDTHGTRVAGIIFGRHNGIGVDGIAPAAELIAIRDATTWTSATLLSFNLARLAGADVINCSWNSRLVLEPVADTIADLATRGREGKGVALVFAAGNEGLVLQEKGIEAGLPEVIAVGAVGTRGQRLRFSNFGDGVDLFAFGDSILTTSNGPEKYGFFSGTSASAAIVSGVAALLLSRDPAMDLSSLRQQLALIFPR